MSPYPPTVIDLSASTVSARDGLWHPIDRLAVAAPNLYFGRRGANDPRIASQERWLFADRGWSIIRWTLEPGAEPIGYDWYIDVDRIEPTDCSWSIVDRYLDVIVREGQGYEVLDANELADALETASIAHHDAVAALRALNDLLGSLRTFDMSVKRLLRELAPGLPG